MPFIPDTPIRGALCIECWEQDQKRTRAVVTLNGHDLCERHALVYDASTDESGVER